MALADSYWPSINDGAGPNYVTLDQIGQSYTTGNDGDYVITQIDLRATRFGLPGTVTVSVYATDESGFPTGVALSTGTFNGDDLTAWTTYFSADTVSVTMSSATLSENTKYAIAISGTFDFLNHPRLHGTSVSGYSLGIAIGHIIATGLWASIVTTVADFAFKVYGDATLAKATTPTPSNGATGVDFSGFQLSWVNGGGATSYDVYIGESGNLTEVSANQVGTTYTTTLTELQTIFGVSPINQVIYWRIDAQAGSNIVTGDEWNFDPRPAKATVVSPLNAATGVIFTQVLEWS